MRCEHGIGVATEVGAGHGSDVRRTRCEGPPKRVDEIVAQSLPNFVGYLLQVAGGPTRAGHLRAVWTRPAGGSISSALLRKHGVLLMQNYLALSGLTIG